MTFHAYMKQRPPVLAFEYKDGDALVIAAENALKAADQEYKIVDMRLRLKETCTLSALVVMLRQYVYFNEETECRIKDMIKAHSRA